MADIQITDISNGSITIVDSQYVWTGTGIFDRLMKAINGNIKVEYDNGRINSTEYATVYLGALQSAIAASMDYLLREKLIEEQIAASQAQTANQTAKTNADITNQTAETNANVALKAKQSLLIDEQVVSEQKDQLIKDEQILKLQEEVDLLQTQDSEMQLDGTKNRLLKDEQIASEKKNQLVKDKQALLIERQKTAYDDNLRVEEAKITKDTIFGFALGGQTEFIDNTRLTNLESKIASITP